MASIKSFRVIFGLIISILLLVSYMAYRSLNNLIEDAKWVNRTNVVLRELEKVISYVKDGETAHRGYQLTEDSLYLKPYYNSKWMALSKIDMVDSLMLRDHKNKHIDSLRMLVNKQYTIIEQILTHHQINRFGRYRDSLLYAGNENMTKLRRLIDQIEDEEWNLLRQRTSQQDYSSKVTPLLIFISFVFAIIAVAYLFSQVFRSLRTKIVTEGELEKNLMQLSEEVNEKVLAQASLEKVLDNSASAIMFLKALRDDRGAIYDFVIVLSNRRGKPQPDGSYASSAGQRLTQIYPGTVETGIFDLYKDVVETGNTCKTEMFYNYDGLNSWYDISAVKLDDGCVSTSTDITERKRDAYLIRENQKKFEAIFNQTFQFIGLLDPKGCLLDINRATLEFAGVSKEEVIGKFLWETPWWKLSEAARIRVHQAVEEAARGEFVRYELDLLGGGEEVLPVDFSLKPVKDDEEKTQFLILECRDLSEIKNAETERSFISKLNLIIANSNSFDEAVRRIFQQIVERFDLDYSEVWLPEGDELLMSDIFYARDKELQKLHEYSNFMKLKRGEGFPAGVMDTLDTVYIENIKEVTGKQLVRKRKAVELGLESVFGIPIIFNSKLVLIFVFYSKQQIGEFGEIMNAIQQISSSLGALLIKKKAQDEVEKNNIILANAEFMARMGSWEWNLPLNKVKWSKGVYELYNKPYGDLVPTYEAIFKYVYPEDLEAVESKIREAIRNKAPYHIEFRVLLDNDEIRHHSVAATPKLDPSGEIESFYGTVQDVTQQKHYEHDLLIKNEELRKSNENLEQFAYVASHDLQEPLRKIRAFGDRLVSIYAKILDDRGRDYIQRMQSAAERMQSLIDDLLKYSRVARSLKPFENVDLNEVINGVLTDLEVRINERQADIRVPQMPLINGDKMQLRQLFQNLISNSIKFTPKDRKPEVAVSWKKLKSSKVKELFNFNSSLSKHFIEIDIKDNGIGFDDKYTERIFNIFERLHGRNEFKGTGIGLAICQKVVQNHGGMITASSGNGNGAMFTILLPVNNQNHYG